MSFLEQVYVAQAASLTSPLLWFYIVLAGCIVTVWLAYGVRDVFCRSAWVTFALFFVWVAASNSWQLIPKPDPAKITDPDEFVEAWRLWSVYLRETLLIAYLAAGAVSLGVASWLIWGAYTQTVRITMLTVINFGVTFVAQIGEVFQRYLCSTNSADIGKEYLFWAAGRGAEGCGRLFADVLQIPMGETIGPLFFPALTALPLPLILWRTYSKKRA